MSQIFEPNEPVNFEKWVSKELGYEMVRRIKENQYINIGQMKHVFDYMFSNLYSEKYVRLVKLNLKLNSESVAREKNDELTLLRIKQIEQKKKISQLKSALQDQEQETNSVIRNINEIKSSKSTLEKNELLNKQLNIMLLENNLKKTKQIKSKIENATEKLSLVIDTQSTPSHNESISSEMRKDECENLIHNFNMTIKNTKSGNTPRKYDSILGESLSSRCTKKLNKLSIKECLKYFDSKIQEESVKISQIVDEKHILNEIDLLKYQMSSKQFDSPNIPKSSLSLSQAINQEYLGFIKRFSEVAKFKREKEQTDLEYEQSRHKLNEYFRKQFTGEELQLYGRFLRSHIMLKRYEANLCELNKFLEKFETEKEYLKKSFNLIQEKYQKIKDFDNLIHEKQLKLEELFGENAEFFNGKFQISMNQIRVCSEQLFEIIRFFNSSNQVYSNRNDSSILFANNNRYMSQFKLKFNNSQNQSSFNQQHQCNQSNEFRLGVLENLLKFNEFNQAKCFLFSKLLENYLSLMSQVKSINSTGEDHLSNQEAKKLIGDLKKQINQCVEIDKENIHRYYTRILEKCAECNEKSKNMQKMEAILNVWWTQPAAYECFLENFNVNSKPLDYYLNYIDEMVAQSNRKNVF